MEERPNQSPWARERAVYAQVRPLPCYPSKTSAAGLLGMRMSAEDANPATQTASVMGETAAVTAAVAPPGDGANGVDVFSTLSQPAVPALEENLQGKELLDALKKQVSHSSLVRVFAGDQGTQIFITRGHESR